MTCTHISQARIKINSLIANLNNINSRVYEEFGPFVYPSNIKTHLDEDGIIFKDYRARSSWTNNYRKIVKKSSVEEDLEEVESILCRCSCYENESTRRNDLIDSHREERESIKGQIETIRNSYEKLIDDQKTLVKEEKAQSLIVRAENSNLQHALGLSKAQVQQLEIRLAEKSNDFNKNKEALERLNRVFQDLLVSDATHRAKSEAIEESLNLTKEQLLRNDSRMDKKEEALEKERRDKERIHDSLTEIRLEKGSLALELEQSKVLIRNLETNSKKSQEELLKKILELLEEKMEELVEEYPITLKQLENLRIHYECLCEARKNHIHNDINVNERKIIDFKQLLSDKGIRIKNIQKICRECEKIAQIRFELGIGTKNSSQQQNTFTEKQSPNYSNNNDYNRGRSSNRN